MWRELYIFGNHTTTNILPYLLRNFVNRMFSAFQRRNSYLLAGITRGTEATEINLRLTIIRFPTHNNANSVPIHMYGYTSTAVLIDTISEDGYYYRRTQWCGRHNRADIYPYIAHCVAVTLSPSLQMICIYLRTLLW